MSVRGETNPVAGTNGTQAGGVALSNPSAERELKAVLALDDEAQAEVDRWLRDNQEFAAQNTGLPNAELNRRIRSRFAPVRSAYENFIQQHTNHVRARIAFASFLGELQDAPAQLTQLEAARELDPKNPALWNNLALYYVRNGPVTNAFDCHAKAMALNPAEPLYEHNFGRTLFLFRAEAMEHFGISEQQVFEKALAAFGRALKLAPGNFVMATDLANVYYGIRPARLDEGLGAWTNALSFAHDDLEREGVQVHLARIKTQAGRLDEARAHLNGITNASYAELKTKLMSALENRKAEIKQPAGPATKPQP